jgi:hypothetical protein
MDGTIISPSENRPIMIAIDRRTRPMRTGKRARVALSAGERVRQRCSLDKLILDLSSSMSETYGRRERWQSPAAISRPVQGIVAPTIQWACRHNDTTSILLIWSSQTTCKMTPFGSGTCLQNPF